MPSFQSVQRPCAGRKALMRSTCLSSGTYFKQSWPSRSPCLGQQRWDKSFGGRAIATSCSTCSLTHAPPFSTRQTLFLLESTEASDRILYRVELVPIAQACPATYFYTFLIGRPTFPASFSKFNRTERAEVEWRYSNGFLLHCRNCRIAFPAHHACSSV